METKLNPTINANCGLSVKHNDVLCCLYEGKFLVSLRGIGLEGQ